MNKEHFDWMSWLGFGALTAGLIIAVLELIGSAPGATAPAVFWASN